MFKSLFFSIGIFLSVSCFANNGFRLKKITFPTGLTKLTQDVMKQASAVYNELPDRNFTRVQIKGLGEEEWSRYDLIQLAKKRAVSIREFYIGIGCLGKNIRMDLAGIPSIILFKPRATYSLSGRIDLNKIEQQCFTIAVSKKDFFTTKSGNVFVFEQNSFVNQNEMNVVGNVNVCIWEFYKQKDMIVSQLSSCGKEEVLETASTFYIQVVQGDKKLDVKKGKAFKVYLQHPSDADGFKAYYGDVRNGNVTWLEDKKSYTYTSLFDEGELYENTKNSNSFLVRQEEPNADELEEKLLLTGKKIGWINCDRIIHVRNPCELEVLLADVTDEFTVRLALSKRNVVVPGLINSNYLNKYKFSKVPAGEPAFVIAYKERGDGYYVAYSQVTLGYINSLNLKPQFKTRKEFESLLESFLN